MCLIEDNEVAITMPNQRTVQFLSIRNHSIRETGMVTTIYQCFGLAAVTRGEILVSGRCFDTWSRNKCYWSIIERNGNVKLHHEFVSHYTSYVYAALDMSKSRVYLSVGGSNALHCFGLKDGKQYFVYSSNDLRYPMGVAVDRVDNIYGLGRKSNNIHKLSYDGLTLQIITTGVPYQQTGISFNSTMDHLVITNGSETRKLHFFVNN
ncbi:hypothetical protein CHS0354_032145 [Potamilus streckersoni]|uniref:Uncharacterized protein n=1 Tax=Potamilus streckersoni TaxID=2493646 RepID=A0AAE0THK4_9BIVA|nr:hypothetical protein CHS0354_032145 [Potamilus streckersoni]